MLVVSFALGCFRVLNTSTVCHFARPGSKCMMLFVLVLTFDFKGCRTCGCAGVLWSTMSIDTTHTRVTCCQQGRPCVSACLDITCKRASSTAVQVAE